MQNLQTDEVSGWRGLGRQEKQYHTVSGTHTFSCRREGRTICAWL